MKTKDEHDIYQNQLNFSGRYACSEWRSKARMRIAGAACCIIATCFPSNSYSLSAQAIPASDEERLNGGIKRNYAENRWKNVKNSSRNPLIFREIPRNYGVGIIILLSELEKRAFSLSQTTYKPRLFAAIRTSQVVEFRRNLAYSHKKTAGGGRNLRWAIYDIRALGRGWWGGRFSGLLQKAKEGRVNGLGGLANGSS